MASGSCEDINVQGCEWMDEDRVVFRCRKSFWLLYDLTLYRGASARYLVIVLGGILPQRTNGTALAT